MSILFPKADASEYHSSPSQLQALLLTCQKDLHYGLVEIAYPGGEKLELFFSDRKISCAYAINEGGWKAIPPSEYQINIQDKECDVRILPLPLDGIRIGKVTVECEQVGQTITIPTVGIRAHLDQLSRQPQSKFLHIRWPGAEAFLVVPGSKMPIREVLFTSPEQILSEGLALGRALSWAEPSCDIATIAYEGESDACQEYYLHLYFTQLLDILLKRYGELSSISLVNIAGEAFNVDAKKLNLNIHYLEGGILDMEFFRSPQAAFIAYQTLANVCLAQFAIVLGTKLTQTIVQEAIDATSQTGRELLQKYPILRKEFAAT